MAHRLIAAGVPTKLSDHFRNYQVTPKNEPHSQVCCFRPEFLCFSQQPEETRWQDTGCRHVASGSCPVCVKCCLPAPQRVSENCCLPKPCCCCVCCGPPNTKIVSCPQKRTYAIKITLPESDTSGMEQKILEKMKKLRKDIRKFDDTISCLEMKNSKPCQPMACVAVTSSKQCRCCEKPVACQMCYVPVLSEQKLHC